jgi:hypothetical protein
MPAAPVRGRTGVFERIRALPDNRVVDRVLRSRGCIWIIGVMLGGIVAMQVSQLRLNSGISRAVKTQQTLELQNSTLNAQLSELMSGERTRTAAAALGMIDPPAGDTRYLTSNSAMDVTRALGRMKPPSDLARQVMANHGMLPGVSATPAAPVAGAAATTVAPTVPNVAATATPVPATAAQVTPTATATPLPTAVPIAPPVQTAPGTGAATAPTGQG